MDLKFLLVVNVRNQEKKIKKCIQSILDQTYKNFTCIITDDCSTDKTFHSCLALIKDDPRFVIKKNDFRKFALKNQFEAFKYAGPNDIVAIIDGDDYLTTKNSLKHVAEIYQKDSKAEMTSWGFEIVNYKGTRLSKYKSWKPKNPRDPNQWIEAHFRTFRKKLFDRIPTDYFYAFNGQLPTHSCDSILCYIMAQLAKKIVQLKKTCYSWDLSSSTDHDFNYEDDFVLRSPTKLFYKNHAAVFAKQIQKTNKIKNPKAGVEISTFEDLGIIHGGHRSEKYIAIVPFKNQATRLSSNIKSMCKYADKYSFGIVFIDDMSTDGSSLVILNEMKKYPNVGFTLIKNAKPHYRMRNIYNAGLIVATNPESVLMEIDGDDELADKDVFSILNKIYKKGFWCTYGAFEAKPKKGNSAIHEFIKNKWLKKNFSKPWGHEQFTTWNHLKTYKKHLLHEVELKYFIEVDSSNWVIQGDDLCLHGRIAEIAKSKVKLVEEVLYKYWLGGTHHWAMTSNLNRRAYTYEKVYKTPDGYDKDEHAKNSKNKKKIRYAYNIPE